MQTKRLEQATLLTDKQAADQLHVAIQTLRNWRCRGIGPDYVRLGRNVFYTQAGISSFIESRIVHVQG